MEENTELISNVKEEIKKIKLDIIDKLDKLDELLNNNEDDFN